MSQIQRIIVFSGLTFLATLAIALRYKDTLLQDPFGKVHVHLPSKTRNCIAFVTAVFGSYEKSLKEPALQDTETSFIAFTDRNDLNTSGTAWQIIQISDEFWRKLPEYPEGRNSLSSNTHSFNKAKYFKLQWNRVPELLAFKYVVWIDATVKITSAKASSSLIYLMNQGLNAITFEHVRQGMVWNEVTASLVGSKYMSEFWQGQKQPYQNVTEQYENYTHSGFSEKWWLARPDVPFWVPGRSEYGVYVTCFLGWNAALKQTSEFLDMWWQENVETTTQDQITFPYVAWKLSMYPFPLPQGNITGTADSNSLYEKLPHGS